MESTQKRISSGERKKVKKFVKRQLTKCGFFDQMEADCVEMLNKRSVDLAFDDKLEERDQGLLFDELLNEIQSKALDKVQQELSKRVCKRRTAKHMKNQTLNPKS